MQAVRGDCNIAPAVVSDVDVEKLFQATTTLYRYHAHRGTKDDQPCLICLTCRLFQAVDVSGDGALNAEEFEECVSSDLLLLLLLGVVLFVLRSLSVAAYFDSHPVV